MKIHRNLIIVGLLLSSAMSGRAQTGPTDTMADERLDQRINIEPIQNLTTERAIARVLSAIGLPGGIIEVDTCAVRALPAAPETVSVKLAGLTGRQALDLIVAKNPQYKWIFTGRVVNFIPAAGLPAIMNTRVVQFETRQDSTNIDFDAKLLSAPEVKEFLLKHGYEEEDRLRFIIGAGRVPLTRSLSLRNVTVLDILNEAAQSYEVPAVWHYSEHVGHCQQTYYLEWPVL